MTPSRDRALAPLSKPVPAPRLGATLAALAGAVLLHGCMVVPLEPHRIGSHSNHHSSAPVLLPAAPLQPPGPQLLSVRLYPLNTEANRAGALAASVMDTMNGRGVFTIAYQGRNLSGEATRVSDDFPGFGQVLRQAVGEGAVRVSGRRGIANAAGPGLNAQCEYVLSGPAQGVGACQFSDGARYQMHFGQ
jgi:hypothetical protein